MSILPAILGELDLSCSNASSANVSDNRSGRNSVSSTRFPISLSETPMFDPRNLTKCLVISSAYISARSFFGCSRFLLTGGKTHCLGCQALARGDSVPLVPRRKPLRYARLHQSRYGSAPSTEVDDGKDIVRLTSLELGSSIVRVGHHRVSTQMRRDATFMHRILSHSRTYSAMALGGQILARLQSARWLDDYSVGPTQCSFDLRWTG